jgi:Domain of unknown function (DUF4365)
VTKDDIGDRGQLLLSLLLTDLCGRDVPYFRPRFLGDKYPTFDFIVEVVDNPAYFFFAQVKATTKGYTKEQNRLIVQLDQTDVDRMVACPAPTYLIGIDVNQIGVGYLLSINEPCARVASMTTKFKIDCSVLKNLRDEVIEYWKSRDMVLKGSRFRE